MNAGGVAEIGGGGVMNVVLAGKGEKPGVIGVELDDGPCFGGNGVKVNCWEGDDDEAE